ncbi:MAG: DUF2236 domain-containing protein [Rubrivivax sp.]|nr:MAG: DUF2236 domain-containing protein [Rubrivivax sp.]
MTGLILPRPLQRRLERLANGFMQPEGGPVVDFSQPAGEPALLPPDALSWVVFKNPLALAIGGVAAVILELAEPRVRTGVWEHTSFRTAPLPRLQRTGLAAMMTVYGPRAQTEAMIARVNRLHARVAGETPAGQPYGASDPALLDWVQATAAFGFSEAYSVYARPLSPHERDALYAEGAVAARLYGAHGAPTSVQQMDALFDRMRPLLEPSPIVFEFLQIMRRAPILPWGLRSTQGLLVKAAVDIVPPWARDQLQIGTEWRLSAWERAAIKLAARGADRLILRDSPAVQSCLRLGLSRGHLYRHR